MSPRHNKSGNSGRGQRGSDGISLLCGVDLTMPSPPGLGRSKHPTSTTHVTEGTLSRTGCTSTTNTGNTGYGTTGSPGGSGYVLTSVDGDGVGLTFVFGHVGVDELDNVRTDGGCEYLGERGGGAFLSGDGENGQDWAGGHFGG
mmetsp:Transcript_35960/g.42953  ORF Transcript_35960/g.42953 Transcript_35960/m.42953 type:complete len:144 (+) Transcript_35960:751-1182(+)